MRTVRSMIVEPLYLRIILAVEAPYTGVCVFVETICIYLHHHIVQLNGVKLYTYGTTIAINVIQGFLNVSVTYAKITHWYTYIFTVKRTRWYRRGIADLESDMEQIALRITTLLTATVSGTTVTDRRT